MAHRSLPRLVGGIAAALSVLLAAAAPLQAVTTGEEFEGKGVHGMAVTEPSNAGGVWIGADPGGKNAFGVALVDESGKTRCKTVSSVHEAVEWIKEAGTPLGVGIDAPMWWSADEGGGRRADERLRRAYNIHPGTVQSVNSLKGAAIVGGALLASRTREAFPRVRITESHPKALLKALRLDDAAFALRFGIDNAWSGEHQRDAVIAAVCAREGFCGRWRVDLSKDRSKLEQNPHNYWLAPVSYFWPERPEGRRRGLNSTQARAAAGGPRTGQGAGLGRALARSARMRQMQAAFFGGIGPKGRYARMRPIFPF